VGPGGEGPPKDDALCSIDWKRLADWLAENYPERGNAISDADRRNRNMTDPGRDIAPEKRVRAPLHRLGPFLF
jgi:hypothetical protein